MTTIDYTESKNTAPYENDEFVAKLEQIRASARKRMTDGAVTEQYPLDLDTAIGVLNDALATEVVCMLRYLNHAYTAQGIRAEVAVEEFKEHADEEQTHMRMIAERVSQLGGEPNLAPSTLEQRAHAGYETADSLAEMIRADLIAERVAIDMYREMVRWFGDRDPTTRRILEEVLEQEEEHADDMASLYSTFTDN